MFEFTSVIVEIKIAVESHPMAQVIRDLTLFRCSFNKYMAFPLMIEKHFYLSEMDRFSLL
jgi:hypothetical protein